MTDRTESIPFFMALSITLILILGSWGRVHNDLDEVESIREWLNDSPSSVSKSRFPYETPLCSMSGKRLKFWSSMSFINDFFDNKKWLQAHQGVFELNGSNIDFLWHKKQNFQEEDLPHPDRGKFWRSSSRDYFVYYFGDTYSNLYCRNFQVSKQR